MANQSLFNAFERFWNHAVVLLEGGLSNKLNAPTTTITTQLPVSDPMEFYYTLTSPNEKLIIETENAIESGSFIYINGTDIECMHDGTPMSKHVLPDDLVGYSHGNASGINWAAGTTISIQTIPPTGDIISVTSQIEEPGSATTKIHTLDITYTDGTTSTIKIVGVE